MTDTQQLRDDAWEVANKVMAITGRLDQYEALSSNIRDLNASNTNDLAFRNGVMNMLDFIAKD